MGLCLASVIEQLATKALCPEIKILMVWKQFSSSVWCPQGNLVAVHRKVHLFDIGK
jgi:hypothetical protein